MAESLLEIKKAPVEKVLAGLLDENQTTSKEAGLRLNRQAGKYALGLRDYLTLAVETKGTQMSDLSGYEAALVFLNLPVKDDFKEGIVLQAASETFQTFPGTRALFPPVIDDMLYWTKRIDNMERLEPMLAVSRTISGVEVIFTVVNDDGSEYRSFTVPEMGRIPVRSIRTSEATVKMYKHGSGIRTSYEFNRRARLDLLTPFASRVGRELELSKIGAAVNVLVNGDGGTNPAATVIAQSSYNGTGGAGVNATAGTISYRHLLYWLVQRAKNGTPIDTVVGNWDAYFQWLMLFQPTMQGVKTPAEVSAQGSGIVLNAPQILPGPVNFVLASAVPAGKLIGYTRGETLEELIEAGSEVSEQDNAILNQTITYVRSEVTGYRLVYTDTRSILDYSA